MKVQSNKSDTFQSLAVLLDLTRNAPERPHIFDAFRRSAGIRYDRNSRSRLVREEPRRTDIDDRNGEPMNDARTSRRIGKSIFAVLIGIVAGVAVTLATDAVLHAIHLFPPWDQRLPDML